MAQKEIEIAAKISESRSHNQTIELNPLLTRREMLGITGMAGLVALTSTAAVAAMLGWPGAFSQYHASNSQPHWITEMMVTGKEPFHAERLLLSTGIVAYNMDSNWENGRYFAIGRRILTHS
jgi:hypothetical protein